MFKTKTCSKHQKLPNAQCMTLQLLEYYKQDTLMTYGTVCTMKISQLYVVKPC